MRIKSERKSLPVYLKEIPKSATHITDNQAMMRFKPYKFALLQEGLTHTTSSKNFKKGTITQNLFTNNFINECISWLKVKCPHEGFYSKARRLCRTFFHFLEHLVQKLAKGLG